MSIMPDNPDEIGDDLPALQEILNDAESTSRLTSWEQDFIDDLRDRVLTYGKRTRVSPKQQEIIDRIEKKLYG